MASGQLRVFGTLSPHRVLLLFISSELRLPATRVFSPPAPS